MKSQKKNYKNEKEKINELIERVKKAKIVVKHIDDVGHVAIKRDKAIKELGEKLYGWEHVENPKEDNISTSYNNAKIVFNYIINCQTNYNDLIKEFKIKDRHSKPKFMLNCRLFEKINKVYPEFNIFFNPFYLTQIEAEEREL